MEVCEKCSTTPKFYIYITEQQPQYQNLISDLYIGDGSPPSAPVEVLLLLLLQLHPAGRPHDHGREKI
jgi:hypothetical protein